MSTADLAEAIAAMTPEERAGAKKLLGALDAMIDAPAPAPIRRRRAAVRPRTSLPKDVTPEELERHRTELAARGLG